MSTSVTGKLGGQYILRSVTDGIYSVAGLSHGDFRMLWKGEYEEATKLLDYCATHDGEAQSALHQLYFEADPTPLTELLEAARDDKVAQPRRRVHVWVRVVTDVLESESAIENVTQRVSQVAGMTGLVITQLECFYADANEKFVAPYVDSPQPPKEEIDRLVQATKDAGDEPVRLETRRIHPRSIPTDRDEPTGSSFTQ